MALSGPAPSTASTIGSPAFAILAFSRVLADDISSTIRRLSPCRAKGGHLHNISLPSTTAQPPYYSGSGYPLWVEKLASHHYASLRRTHDATRHDTSPDTRSGNSLLSQHKIIIVRQAAAGSGSDIPHWAAGLAQLQLRPLRQWQGFHHIQPRAALPSR
jgi:hypothetical protein